MSSIRVAIITVSDRAASGAYADRSGPALHAACRQHGWQPAQPVVVPDAIPRIQQEITGLTQTHAVILLTGGTGIGPRDVTPEAVRELADRELPGFGEVMRARSFERFPHAILSRSFAAVVGRSLVICLPGNPAGAVECLGYVAGAVSHAVEVIGGVPGAHASTGEAAASA